MRELYRQGKILAGVPACLPGMARFSFVVCIAAPDSVLRYDVTGNWNVKLEQAGKAVTRPLSKALEQVGLKLEFVKAPIDVLVIDKADKRAGRLAPHRALYDCPDLCRPAPVVELTC